MHGSYTSCITLKRRTGRELKSTWHGHVHLDRVLHGEDDTHDGIPATAET